MNLQQGMMMRHRSGLVIGLTLVLVFLLRLPVAYACSAGPDFNPLTESDIIVGGRVRDWQPLHNQVARDQFIPIQVTLDVDQSFKGRPTDSITFVDVSSRQALSTTEAIWVGGSGPCGAFDSDPIGKYVILGLTQEQDGTYQTHRLLTFFLGSAPQGHIYEQALARLAAFQPAPLPNTGDSPLGSPWIGSSPALDQLVLVGLTLLLGGHALVAISRRRI
jgi:hypothetical protein